MSNFSPCTTSTVEGGRECPRLSRIENPIAKLLVASWVYIADPVVPHIKSPHLVTVVTDLVKDANLHVEDVRRRIALGATARGFVAAAAPQRLLTTEWREVFWSEGKPYVGIFSHQILYLPLATLSGQHALRRTDLPLGVPARVVGDSFAIHAEDVDVCIDAHLRVLATCPILRSREGHTRIVCCMHHLV